MRAPWIATLVVAAVVPIAGAPAGPPVNVPGTAAPVARSNHLRGQTSPYLLEHLDNPVDWYPWEEAALARARDEDKPIFLSIGYSACHWCHVMARESFSDPEIARLLEQSFIAIKVDREERPDLDAIYMDAVVLMTGGGGWPMSVFLTPDLEPFHGGTYFPRERFRALLTGIASTWKQNRAQVLAVGRQVREHLARPPAPTGPSGAVPAGTLLDGALAQWRASYDPAHGGFGGAPKFPSPLVLQLLLRAPRQGRSGPELEMVTRSLEAMASGGLYDQLGGGFHRYATDAAWRVPHFEKMLYDNALLVPVYLEAWRATGRAEFRRVAEETLSWVAREMTDARGGFYASLDADSEGEEGRFYLWTTAEIRRVLDDRDAAFAIDYFGLSDRGDLPGGGNVLHVPSAPAEFAPRHGVSEAAVRARVAEVRAKLLAARASRPRPRRDDKILTAWNGLMISAYARAYGLTGDLRDREAATRAAGFALDALLDRDGRVMAVHRPGGQPPLPGTLDDSAFLARGLLDLYDATSSRGYLEAATGIVRDAERFLDRTGGGYFFAAEDRRNLIVRTKSFEDQALPSGNAVLLECQARLARALADPALLRRARRTLDIAGPALRGAPAGSAAMILATLQVDAPVPIAPRTGALGSIAVAASRRVTPALAAGPAPAAGPRATGAGEEIGKGDRIVSGVVVGRANAQRVVEASVAIPGGTVRPGQAITLSLRLAIAPGWHINSSRPTLDYLIATSLAFPDSATVRVEEIAYPEGSIVLLEFAQEKLSVYQGAATIRATISLPPEAPPGRSVIAARLVYQACSDKTCLAPETIEFLIPIDAGGEPVIRAPAEGTEGGAPPAARGGGLESLLGQGRGGEGIQALLDRRGLLVLLGVVFLAGLALNLTPCVYPMMPITIGFFANQALGSWGRRIGLPALYVLGMAVTYSILGLVAGLTGTLFGSTLQSPWITGGLVLIFMVMALSMFGLFEIQMPRFLTRLSGGRQGTLGAFLMGLTMGIAAAPCIGPFIVPLLAFVGVSGKPVLGFWLFFVMAIGMGVPNLFLGAFSGAMAALPRSGLWLIYAKKVMGVALLAVALYFLQPFLKDRWLGVMALGFAAVSGFYLGVLDRTRIGSAWFRPVKIGIGLLVLSAGAWIAGPLLRARPELDWRPYAPEALVEARAAGRPVIIDFSAAWCLPCRELERFTFADSRVLGEAERFTLLKADLTSFEAAPVRDIRARFEVVGVPTVIFIDGTGVEKRELRVYGFEEPARFVLRMKQVN